MLKMYMIRHGKTYGNTQGRYIGITDEPLLPEEAADLEQYSLGTVDRVFASPRKRCLETAAILFPGQEITVVEEFAECDFGEFENKNYQELSGNPNYQRWVDSGGTLEFPGRRGARAVSGALYRRAGDRWCRKPWKTSGSKWPSWYMEERS